MRLVKDRILFVVAVILYGTIGLFLRFVDLPSEAVAFYRGVIGGTCILVYKRIKKEKPDLKAIRNNLVLLILSGVMLGLNWIFLFAAYVNTTVAVASLCNYMAPVLLVLLTPLILKERLDWRKIPCILAALAGIVLVSGVFGGDIGNPLGILYGLLAAACFTVLVFLNRKLKDISEFDRSFVQLYLSALTIFPYMMIHNEGWFPFPSDLQSGLIVLMLGILHTGVAYCFYFNGMAVLPVQTVAILGYLEPVVSVLCSAFFLQEAMGVPGWIGAVLILAAAVVSERIPPPGKKQDKPSEKTTPE